MNIRAIGNTYVYNTETKYLSRNDEKGNDSIGYAVSDESCPKNNFEPALSYSEYKEIADNWRLSQASSQPASDEKSSRELLQGKIEEMQENIENGDLDHEPVVKIGASEFTETEWDTFLENFDDLQEEIREAMKLEYEKALKESEEEALMQKELMEKDEEEERLDKEKMLKEEVQKMHF